MPGLREASEAVRKSAVAVEGLRSQFLCSLRKGATGESDSPAIGAKAPIAEPRARQRFVYKLREGQRGYLEYIKLSARTAHISWRV